MHISASGSRKPRLCARPRLSCSDQDRRPMFGRVLKYPATQRALLPPTIKNMTLTREQKLHLLSKIDRFVQEKFYDPNFNGRDWHGLVSQYREPILNSPTPAAFEESVT